MKLLKLIIKLADFTIKLLFKVSILEGSEQEREIAEREGRTVQIVKIWTRATVNLALAHDLSNFLFTHETYVHPRSGPFFCCVSNT